MFPQQQQKSKTHIRRSWIIGSTIIISVGTLVGTILVLVFQGPALAIGTFVTIATIGSFLSSILGNLLTALQVPDVQPSRREPPSSSHPPLPTPPEAPSSVTLTSVLQQRATSQSDTASSAYIQQPVASKAFTPSEVPTSLQTAKQTSVEPQTAELWLMPYQRDPFFVDRENELHSLHHLLVPGSTTASTQAISGLGGIGKTHTAVEYAYRFRNSYEAVLWLQADSWEVLASECTKLADALELPKQQETEKVIDIRRWLRKHRHWLLVLDNVENLREILPKVVPTPHQGSVLVTTRAHDVDPLAQTHKLSTMSESDGVLFLLRRTKKIASAVELEQVNEAMYSEAKQLWQLLDGLPLALDQAGAYILETNCSFLAYQEQYALRRTASLQRRGRRFIGHEASVATTFSLAFDQTEALSPVAGDILRVCSLLHSEAIPEELFLKGATHLGLSLVASEESWDLAIGVLLEYSLLQRNLDSRTLTMHRLVQAVLQDSLSEPESEMWIKRVISAMNSVFPEGDHATWNQCVRLVPHILVCAIRTQSWEHTDLDLASLLFKTAKYLCDRAQYIEAESLYQRALHIWEQALGPEHPQVALSLNNLACLYISVHHGKYDQAESLYQRALHIREQALGPEHPQVAYPLVGLASLYKEQGKYDQAESLYQRALLIRERALGPEHPQTTYPLVGLAIIYGEQSKYAEAELLYQRALHIREQALGPEHPQVASLLNGLAGLRTNLGKYSEAESLYQRALHVWRRALGLDHPDTAMGLNNLAILYKECGKEIEAELLYQHALLIWEQALGPEHLYVAYPLNNLASLYSGQGQYDQAEPLYQRALLILKRALGPEHPYVAYLLNNLASLHSGRHQYNQAKPLYQHALLILEQALGPEHPSVAYPLIGLACFYQEQDQYDQAEPLYRRAVAIREHYLGLEHPKTAEVWHEFAAILRAQGKRVEAESFSQRALAICEQLPQLYRPKTMEIWKIPMAVLREMSRQVEVALLESHEWELVRTDEKWEPDQKKNSTERAT